jgi:hypothetical protein
MLIPGQCLHILPIESYRTEKLRAGLGLVDIAGRIAGLVK